MRAFYRILMAAVLLFNGGLIQAQGTVPGQWQDAFYLSPGCDGQVWAMAKRPDGKVFIGGTFRFCDGVKVNRIALFDPVLNSFEPLVHQGEIGVNAVVRALAWADGDLYVGGDLTQAGTLDVNQVARWDGSAWHRLGSALSNGVDWSGVASARVWALVWIAGDLYVGGLFDSAGTTQANNIARWSAGQWHLLGAGADNGVYGPAGSGREVRALQPLGSSLFVGGNFDSAGGSPANGLALWNGANWSAVGEGPSHGPGFDIGTFRWISAFALDGNDLFVAGRFDFEDADSNVCQRCVMRWDGSTWLGLPFESGFSDSSTSQTQDLAIHDGWLYAAIFDFSPGGFESAGLRRWTGSHWQVVGNNSTVARGIKLLSTTGEGLLVGGDVRPIVGQPRHGLVRWADNQFQAAGQVGGQGSDKLVFSVIEHDEQIYAAKLNRVARWDGNQWHFLPGTFNSQIMALASYQGLLYAGGWFTEIDGEPALRIVRFDGTEWLPVGGGFPTSNQPSVSTVVFGFAVANGLLYVVGEFDQAGSVAANSIATWNGSSWSALSSLLGNGLERVSSGGINRPGSVAAAIGHDGDVYVSGNFSLAGGSAASRIARWDGSNWFSLGGGFNDGSAVALSWHAGELHAGGIGLRDNQNNDLGALAHFSGGQWLAVSALQSPSDVRDLFSHDGWLYIAGQNLLSVDEDALARWNGQQWQRFGSGVEYGRVDSVFVTEHSVSIGGTFRQAGPHASSYFGIFDFIEPGDHVFSDRFQPPEPRMGQMP